jgi:site-specific DNA-methyltransferase (adenine-specific)
MSLARLIRKLGNRHSKKTLSFACSKAMTNLRTPHDLWAALCREFQFTVDVCASDDNHLLPRYYTAETDGLKQDWTGEVVYCHPLFKPSVVRRWVKKAYESRCTTVMLIPAGVHTRYFHDWIYHNPKAEVRFLEQPTNGFRFGHDDGRPDDPKRKGYVHPLMLVVFRNVRLALTPEQWEAWRQDFLRRRRAL